MVSLAVLPRKTVGIARFSPCVSAHRVMASGLAGVAVTAHRRGAAHAFSTYPDKLGCTCEPLHSVTYKISVASS